MSEGVQVNRARLAGVVRQAKELSHFVEDARHGRTELTYDLMLERISGQARDLAAKVGGTLMVAPFFVTIRLVSEPTESPAKSTRCSRCGCWRPIKGLCAFCPKPGEAA
jgi:hypothetical protein